MVDNNDLEFIAGNLEEDAEILTKLAEQLKTAETQSRIKEILDSAAAIYNNGDLLMYRYIRRIKN